MAIGCLPFFVMLILLVFAFMSFGIWGVVWVAVAAFILRFMHEGTR